MELNIDRGLKSYDVKDADGTLIGTIRFNPSDIGLAGRMEEARAKIAEITAAPVTGPEDLVEWDRQVRHWFDYIFGTPVSDVFFAGVSSLAFCEDGSLVATIGAVNGLTLLAGGERVFPADYLDGDRQVHLPLSECCPKQNTAHALLPMNRLL